MAVVWVSRCRGGRNQFRGITRSGQNKTRSRSGEDYKSMHHDPLDAGCDAIASSFFPPPRKIVTTPPSGLSLPCKDLGSNGLTSLSIVTVGGAPLMRESVGGAGAVASAL